MFTILERKVDYQVIIFSFEARWVWLIMLSSFLLICYSWKPHA